MKNILLAVMFTAPAAAQRNVHVPVSGVNAIPGLGASLDGARLGPAPLLMSALSPGALIPALIPALAPALVQPAPAAGILAAAAKPAEGSPLGVIRGASANEAQKTAALDRLFENSAPSEHSKGIGAGSKRSPASRPSPSSRRKRTEPPAAGAPLSSPSQENISPTVMITHLSEVFAVRFNENDGVEFKTSDLAASRILTVRELAAADRDGNGWVTVHEVLSTQRMSGSAYFDHEDLMNAARKRRFGAISVAGLRAKLAAGEAVAVPRPARLGRANANLSDLPRSAFVPLAEHLASRLAGGTSYDSSYGDGGKIFHADITDVWRGHSRHEVYAALSILTAREGGMEFGVSKGADGSIHLVQGLPEKLELDSVETGLDLILHTHPRSGADGARPSQGDFFTASEHDPDHIGRVASDDGWFAEYRSLNGNTSGVPRRLWIE